PRVVLQLRRKSCLFHTFNPSLDLVEIVVDYRRDIECQHLRHQQTADNCKTEGSSRFSSGTKPQSNGKRPHQRSHGRHHDRPETYESPLVDSHHGTLAAASLSLQSKIYHHDSIFLHNANQHDDADKRVEIQILAEDQKCQKCAETG